MSCSHITYIFRGDLEQVIYSPGNENICDVKAILRKECDKAFGNELEGANIVFVDDKN